MKFVPHDYQTYAIRFIEQNPVAAVLLEMGLGKSTITLTAIQNLMYDSFDVHKVLVIAPLRVAKNTWSAELEKWEHLKHLTYSVVVGTAEERKAALRRRADIYIINRENIQWLVEQGRFDFAMAVIDELSSFKNHQTKRFRALMKVRPRLKRIVGLTGTPSSNGLMDLFAEFRLLDMGERLGRFIGQFRNTYFQPNKRNGMIVYSYKPLPGAEDAIYEKISDITISMRATDHLKMPELIMSEYTVEMSAYEKEKYMALKKEMILELPDGEVTASNAASLSSKLSQMANGAIYDDNKQSVQIHDRKLDVLEDIIESANGKPILVAYWFKHDLKRIKERLYKLHIPFSTMDKSDSIQKWNNGELPVALIHPASAGHGLNLQSGGNYLVWFGLTWSLELYQQTNARLYRQGQKSATVVIQHIITKGTIDERILKALQDKDEIQTTLLEAVKAEMKKIGQSL